MKTILLVEDNAMIAMGEKSKLQKYGFTVLTAGNGEAAVDIALRTPELDLILMDINLGPGIDGPEAAQQILARRNLPIVFLSSHTEPDVVEKTERITSYGYVVKNSGDTVLLASIKMAFKLFDAHQRLKQQEHVLRENEARLRSLFTAMTEGVVLIAPDGQIIEANSAAERILGLQRSEIETRNYIAPAWNILRPDGTPMPPEEMAGPRAMRGRHLVQDVVMGITRPDGSLRWINVSAAPIINETGNLDGIAGTFTDITDRKRAEEALRTSELWMSSIFNSVDEAILVITPDRTIANVNEAAERVFGYSKDELAKQSTEVLHVDHEHYVVFGNLIKGAFGRGESANFEFEAKRKNGEVFLTEHTVSLLRDRAQNDIGIVSIVRDITGRKRAKEALRESEWQLRELNAQKDKFFSMLAHDLKNPLAGFVAFANLIEQDFDRMAPAERNRLIQHFRMSADLLVALLDNLLTWARLQNGQIKAFPDIFQIDQLVARAVTLLTPNATQKQITLTQTLPALEVYADISMTDTVVRNLLANAMKFTPAGGTVTITATQTPNDVCVTVADTGIGMLPEMVAQLFRVGGKTQRLGTVGEQGTGLGLILCKEFVEQQGGRLWVESEPEKGTRVLFTLPVKGQRSVIET